MKKLSSKAVFYTNVFKKIVQNNRLSVPQLIKFVEMPETQGEMTPQNEK